MAPLDAALRYAGRGWPVFPCQWQGEGRKRPLIERGLHAATTDAATVSAWWTRWPEALIGLPTGEPIGCVVLDIDRKEGGPDGLATLGKIDCPILPLTPTVYTASGGMHLYFQRPEDGLRNTNGERGRGIGPGLDWRGDGGYVILPSPGSGYRWDKRLHFGRYAPCAVPETLLPKSPRIVTRAPMSERAPKRAIGLSRYAEAALDKAARAIINAPGGEQEATLNSEAFSIGTLAGAGGVPADFAKKILVWAARQMRDHDPQRPWRPGEIEFKVARAFADGMRHPRDGRHAA
jgi:putative DNA primase/helicase